MRQSWFWAVWCPVDRVEEISIRLRELKQKHHVLSVDDLRQPRLQQFEVKWTKVSKAKLGLYLDWIDYFFDDDDLHFRGVLIDKSILDHTARQQSHDDWYYKMLFRLLEPIIDPQQQYRVYLDIKDTRSEQKRVSWNRCSDTRAMTATARSLPTFNKFARTSQKFSK